MKLNKGQSKEFDKLSNDMIKFLNDNCHPHVAVIIDNTSSELVEGVKAYRTEKHWKD